MAQDLKTKEGSSNVKCGNGDQKGSKKNKNKGNEKCLAPGKKLKENEEKKKTNKKNPTSSSEVKNTASAVKKTESNTDNSNLQVSALNANDGEKPNGTNKDKPQSSAPNNGAIDPDMKNSKIQKIIQGETKNPDEYPTLADAGEGFEKNLTIEQNVANVNKPPPNSK
uniref:Uncharacterized protein n=1 Tax=Strongyloides venezuelensis TaxID=75913 RepID=A0A0K0FL16_STRVS